MCLRNGLMAYNHILTFFSGEVIHISSLALLKVRRSPCFNWSSLDLR